MSAIGEQFSPILAAQESIDFCRVCNSGDIKQSGTVEYYSGFAWQVFDCFDCGSRFTRHDEKIYDEMYSDSGSIYNVYSSQLEETTKAFKRDDLDALRSYLYQGSKYRFVIEQIERTNAQRLLEIGCSRGHLSSYFILAGYQITGVDVSPKAVRSARDAFGDHFIVDGDSSIDTGAPYDAIYHVGTIGCVADPVGLTRRLLSMLKPRGMLLFNAPNLASCWLKDQLWIDAAPPPDLVSIFPPGFWSKTFGSEAEVEERIEKCPAEKALTIGLGKFLGRHWQKPIPIPLSQSSGHYQNGNGRSRTGAWGKFESFVSRVGRKTGLSRLAPAQPSEFGLFVKMIRP